MTIAFTPACILTAFEDQSHEILPEQYRQGFVDQAFKTGKVNCTVQEVHDSRLKLREIYQNGRFLKPKNERCSDDDVAQNMDSSDTMMSSAFVSNELWLVFDELCR